MFSLMTPCTLACVAKFWKKYMSLCHHHLHGRYCDQSQSDIHLLDYGTVCRISGCIDKGTSMSQSERWILRQGVLRARVICMNVIGRSDEKTDFNYWGQRLVRSTRKSGDGQQWILPCDYQNKHYRTVTIGEHVIYWKISPSLTHKTTGPDFFVVPK